MQADKFSKTEPNEQRVASLPKHSILMVESIMCFDE